MFRQRHADDDDFDQIDEGEAFNNTLIHIGQGMIGHLFRYWNKRWPTIPDGDFLPVLDGVRTWVGGLLGPEQLKELWDWVCWEYEAHCQAKDPKAKSRACEAVLQQYLPEWHRIASEAKPRKKPTGPRGRKRKR